MTWTLAVAGATEDAGGEILNALAERDLAETTVVALALRKSQGVEVSFGDDRLKCKAIEHYDFKGTDLVFLCGDAAFAKEWAPKVAAAGGVAIDVSSAFRLDPAVPLVVPEVNAAAIEGFAAKRLVALPMPTVAQLAAALKPLHEEAGLLRVQVTALEATSGAGRDAMDELFSQTRAIFVGDAPEKALLPKQIAFNVIPQVGDMREDGQTSAEWALMAETRKVLDPDVQIAATSVRVPVFIGHALAVHAEFERPISSQTAQARLRSAPGIMLVDRREDGGYVTPVDAAGDYAVFVSRVRKDPSVAHGLAFWCVADDLKKSLALNAVQIAETLMAKHLTKRLA